LLAQRKGVFTIRLLHVLQLFWVLSGLLAPLAGGIAMCCLYAPGEQLDARGYWIVSLMLSRYFVTVFVALIGGSREEPEDEDAQEA
jgi:hypothetical protein